MPNRGRLLLVLLLGLAACTAPDGGDEGGTGTEPGAAPGAAIDAAADDDDGRDGSAPSTTGAPAVAVAPPAVGRADITPAGNRVLAGAGRLDRVAPLDVELPGTPVLVLPVVEPATAPGAANLTGAAGPATGDWVVELDGGQRVMVEADGTVTPLAPPPAPAASARDRFDDPLPDGVVVAAGEITAALVGPTDRYRHGVLGDRIEAGGVQVVDTTTGRSVTFGPEPPSVIEGIAPLLADLTGDGTFEVLVTHSNAEVGAWLAVWSPSGRLVAESAAIGQGNRWRNQLAVAPVGPGGEMEVIDVRTPHLGGTVEYFRLAGDRLERMATQTGFTSHAIGSRNLDLALVVDADGDGRLDVVTPADDRGSLGILTRSADEDDGVAVVAEVELPGRMTTNLGAAADAGGRVTFAVGTDTGMLRIWAAN
ncbi:MAG: hypothetical protein AAFN30_02525 [Actinomycetota bacterium]